MKVTTTRLQLASQKTFRNAKVKPEFQQLILGFGLISREKNFKKMLHELLKNMEYFCKLSPVEFFRYCFL